MLLAMTCLFEGQVDLPKSDQRRHPGASGPGLGESNQQNCASKFAARVKACRADNIDWEYVYVEDNNPLLISIL